MKRLLLTTFTIIISLTLSAQSMKGYTICTKLNGRADQINTTIGGIKGVMCIEVTANNLIYGFSFTPTNDSFTAPRSLYAHEARMLHKGFCDKYKIRLKPIPTGRKTTLMFDKNGIRYGEVYTFNPNGKMRYVDYKLLICDVLLHAKEQERCASKATNDF